MFLICSVCKRECHFLNLENSECTALFEGTRCKGILQLVDQEFSTERQLKCTTCGRLADDLSMSGHGCNFRFSEGNYCKGILELC